MKRIAAPMVGGLITSAFLTLEIIPAIVTYWRYEQLLWERLEPVDADLLRTLRRWTAVLGGGAAVVTAALVSRLYVTLPGRMFETAVAVGLALFLGGIIFYLARRPAARNLIWPVNA